MTTRYFRGDVVDQLFARIDDTDPLRYLTDHLGSVRDVLDGVNDLAKSVAYDSFGNMVDDSGPGELGRYAWTGREYDVETELQYNRARYYDPTTGRWITQDPLGFDAGDSNLYRYVHNQAVSIADPSGLQSRPQLLGPITPPDYDALFKLAEATRQISEWQQNAYTGQSPLVAYLNLTGNYSGFYGPNNRLLAMPRWINQPGEFKFKGTVIPDLGRASFPASEFAALLPASAPPPGATVPPPSMISNRSMRALIVIKHDTWGAQQQLITDAMRSLAADPVARSSIASIGIVVLEKKQATFVDIPNVALERFALSYLGRKEAGKLNIQHPASDFLAIARSAVQATVNPAFQAIVLANPEPLTAALNNNRPPAEIFQLLAKETTYSLPPANARYIEFKPNQAKFTFGLNTPSMTIDLAKLQKQRKDFFQLKFSGKVRADHPNKTVSFDPWISGQLSPTGRPILNGGFGLVMRW